MKKYLVGLTAVVLAVVTFAFTAPKKVVFADYVWYGIKTSVHIPCDDEELPGITLDDLVIDAKYANTGAFATDISDVTFQETGNPSLFNCNLTQAELCAVGFLKPATGTTGFTVQNGRWVPTITPEQKICRSVAP